MIGVVDHHDVSSLEYSRTASASGGSTDGHMLGSSRATPRPSVPWIIAICRKYCAIHLPDMTGRPRVRVNSHDLPSQIAGRPHRLPTAILGDPAAEFFAELKRRL